MIRSARPNPTVSNAVKLLKEIDYVGGGVEEEVMLFFLFLSTTNSKADSDSGDSGAV
jgi:hypothetical protein